MKHFIEQRVMVGIKLKNKLIIFLILSFITFLNASSIIDINYDFKENKNFSVDYILDNNNLLTIDKVKNLKFKTTSNHHSFGNIPNTLWMKIKFKNLTDIEKKVFLHNDFAYFSKEITIYEFLEDKLIDQNVYDILEKDSNKLVGSALVYPLELQANSSKTLYIKTTPIVTLTSNLNVHDEKRHTQALINKSLLSTIIIIILISLAFYNMILYIFNRRKEFVFYAIYLINASVGLSYMYGILFHNFELYGEDIYWINITAIFVSGFLALFIKYLFDFDKNNKHINTLLNSIIYLVLLDTFIAIFIDLQLAINIVALVYLYSFAIIYYIAYKVYKQNHPLAKIFITAYNIYIIGFTLTILSLFGIIEISKLTLHASGISLVIEALLFSYLIHYHTRILEKKLSDQQNTLILKNQKIQMGDMIGAITHQWKQPLTTIGSIIILLQYKLGEKKHNIEYIEDKINQINNHVTFLAETIDDFKNFFNPKKVKVDSNLEKLVDKAVSLSKDSLLTEEIIIKKDLGFTSNIAVFENELLHIILNIIQNSKEAFMDANIKKDSIKMIKIIGSTNGKLTYIDIIDNAGGISDKNLPYIFHENYTTKEKKKGTGLGLYLSKVIIEDHLNGSIEVKNIGDGTMFRIIL